jgi:phosphoglycolate phosphatase
MRTSLGHDDLIAAGAVCTAESFDDPELLRLAAQKMGW